MLLAFDIGNTEITVGLFSNEELRAQWRLTTQVPRTPDELQLLLGQLIDSVHCAPTDVTGIILASVVPAATQRLVDACQRCFGINAMIVTSASPLPITFDVDDPGSVGADRVVNTFAARHLYQRDVIVVALGTATTYNCMTAQGVFLGGVIQPGVRTSADALVHKTSLLPATAMTVPAHVIGKNTVDCIRAGVMFGAADSIDGVIRRMKNEWPSSSTPYVVATGGLSSVFESVCSEFDIVDPALTLKGLQLAYTILSAS